MGSIAATGDRGAGDGTCGKVQGVIFAPEVNCYKCPIGHTYPGCGIACAEYIEHMIVNESDVAAVILEPVVGTNGCYSADGIHAALRKICDAHGVLLIATNDDGLVPHGEMVRDGSLGRRAGHLTTAKALRMPPFAGPVCHNENRVDFDEHSFRTGIPTRRTRSRWLRRWLPSTR